LAFPSNFSSTSLLLDVHLSPKQHRYPAQQQAGLLIAGLGAASCAMETHENMASLFCMFNPTEIDRNHLARQK
jgi:hypothetical protein